MTEEVNDNIKEIENKNVEIDAIYENGKKENNAIPAVEKIFENVKNYEELCTNLPTVPEDIDELIESKLMKLKDFNKIWQNDGKTDEELSEERFEKVKIGASSKFKIKHDEEKGFDYKTHKDYEDVFDKVFTVEEANVT